MRDKIRQFIFENFLFGDPDDNLKDDHSFLGKGVIDSTGVLELVAFLVESFRIRMEDEELVPENLDSINSLINFINKKTTIPVFDNAGK